MDFPLSFALSVASVLCSTTPEAPSNGLEARVDLRVELMSIIYRLSGANEYNQPLASSPYADEVDAHFGKFRDHAAVRAAGNLRAQDGIGYDAPMALALHLDDTVTFAEKIPFGKKPPRLVPRWKVRMARDFVKKVKDFAEKTKFNDFAEEHRGLYEATAGRMSSHLSERPYVDWFDSYFGARPGAKFSVIVSLLNGPCNYGTGIRHPDGTEEISPIIGASKFDDKGIPVFDESASSTIVHEFCHTYTNPIVASYLDQLLPAGNRIFKRCEAKMDAMAYGTPQSMLNESFVRAVVIRYVLAVEGEKAARAQIEDERGRGFAWVGYMSHLLADYELGRRRYGSFEAFTPKIIQFFTDYAEDFAREDMTRSAEAPKVVSMTPENGATNVDPNLSEIRVVFDRRMKDGNWAVVGGGPNYPDTGRLHYDKDCKVLTIPVTLKPNWPYELWLNHPPYDAFQSAEGAALEPVHVTFKTRSK